MKLSDLDLNMLVPLEALLHERNTSRAAIRMGVSQSAMSKALSRLRVTFGDELLVRVGQEYCLSPFAEQLIPELQEVLATLEHTLRRRPSFDPAVDRHTFRIAAIDALEYLLLKPLIERITQDAPGIALEIQGVEGEATLDLIRSGELDLGLTSVVYPHSNVSQQVLFEDRRVCAVWRGLPGIGERLTLEQLLTLPHAAYDWGGFNLNSGEYAEWDYMSQVPVCVTDVRLLMRLFMLRGTNLVTFSWESMARAVADVADIRVIEPPFEAAVGQHRMLWHPRETSDPAHIWLRAQLLEIVASLEMPQPELEPAETISPGPSATRAGADRGRRVVRPRTG